MTFGEQFYSDPGVRISTFSPPGSAKVGASLSIPIQISNDGDKDIFDANIDLFDAEADQRLFHGHKSNFLIGQKADFNASLTMPEKDLSLRLELSIKPSPVSIFTVVDTKTAVISLSEEPPEEPPSGKNCLILALFGATFLSRYFPFVRLFRDRVLPQIVTDCYYAFSTWILTVVA